MAREAAIRIGLRVDLSVGKKSLVFPLAIAFALGVFAAPSGTFLHHAEGLDPGFSETAVGVGQRFAVAIELHVVSDQRDHRSAGERHGVLRGGQPFRRNVEFAKLFFVRPVLVRVHHALNVTRRENDFIAACPNGGPGHDDREDAESDRDW